MRRFLPIVLVCALAGCAWFTPAHEADVLTIVSCVLSEAATVSPGEMPTPAQAEGIALDCGLKDAQQVLDLLNLSQTAANKRSMYAR
jgi:hypothetical protein